MALIKLTFDSDWLKKYYHYVSIDDYSLMQLIPRNKEMLQYKNNIVEYYCCYDSNLLSKQSLMSCLKCDNIEDYYHFVKHENLIVDNEHIVFEFISEEEALYFNLKYN